MTLLTHSQWKTPGLVIDAVHVRCSSYTDGDKNIGADGVNRKPVWPRFLWPDHKWSAPNIGASELTVQCIV